MSSRKQDEFWRGDFGENYIDRCRDSHIVKSNLNLFTRVLSRVHKIDSVLELGCNIGLNLDAMKLLCPDGVEFRGVEINERAAEEAVSKGFEIHVGSICDQLDSVSKCDFVFTKGVLIHIDPDNLELVYENLYEKTNRYVMVAEYYSPTPVQLDYRGNDGYLFKRDFAGDLMDRFAMRLIDYGFIYSRDTYFPHDDINWFLLEK